MQLCRKSFGFSSAVQFLNIHICIKLPKNLVQRPRRATNLNFTSVKTHFRQEKYHVLMAKKILKIVFHLVVSSCGWEKKSLIFWSKKKTVIKTALPTFLSFL